MGPCVQEDVLLTRRIEKSRTDVNIRLLYGANCVCRYNVIFFYVLLAPLEIWKILKLVNSVGNVGFSCETTIKRVYYVCIFDYIKLANVSG